MQGVALFSLDPIRKITILMLATSDTNNLPYFDLILRVLNFTISKIAKFKIAKFYTINSSKEHLFQQELFDIVEWLLSRRTIKHVAVVLEL